MTRKITWNHLPVAMPDGALIPHLSARFRTQEMDAIYRALGGGERLIAWASASDENYGAFIKMWARGQARASNVEHSASEGVEHMLERLDDLERVQDAKTINGFATPVDV